MRITTRMMTNKYKRSLNELSASVNQLNEKVSSGRSFSKASENTSAAISAFQIRRNLSRLESYQSNISYASDLLRNAETALMEVNSVAKEASTKILQGINGSNSDSDRAIIAQEIKSLKDQLLQSLNSNSGGTYYFGGTQTDSSPFKDVGGKLTYKGVDLDTLVSGSAEEQALLGDARYIDIGLSLQFDPLQPTKLDSSTAFNIALPGIKFVGSGTTTVDGQVLSNNLYNLLDQISVGLADPNYSSDQMDALLSHFQTQSDKVLVTVTEIGSKSSYLDFMTNRLDSESLNMQERQSEIEYADPAKTIIDFKSQEMAYEAALAMGAKVIQPSIFDYIR